MFFLQSDCPKSNVFFLSLFFFFKVMLYLNHSCHVADVEFVDRLKRTQGKRVVSIFSSNVWQVKRHISKNVKLFFIYMLIFSMRRTLSIFLSLYAKRAVIEQIQKLNHTSEKIRDSLSQLD